MFILGPLLIMKDMQHHFLFEVSSLPAMLQIKPCYARTFKIIAEMV